MKKTFTSAKLTVLLITGIVLIFTGSTTAQNNGNAGWHSNGPDTTVTNKHAVAEKNMTVKWQLTADSIRVQQIHIGDSFNIDISAHSEGIYYVRAVNEFGEIEIKKLVKE